MTLPVAAAGRSIAGPLLIVAFFSSGFASLSYQAAWQRVLTQVIGSDSVAMVLTVVIFMVWLGVGASLARLVLIRTRVGAVRLYACAELGVAVSAVLSIPILRSVNGWFATQGIESVFADFALNLVLLAVPVTAMGMTTPLVVEAAKHTIEDLGRTVGTYYGINIVGAAAGSLLTGLALIELLGLQGVTFLAAATNAAIAVAVWGVFRNTSSMDIAVSRGSSRFPLSLMVSAVLFGFGTLALQVIFFRVLSNYFTLSSIVFPLVLAAYLLLMAAGQWVGGRLADRWPDRLESVIVGLVAVGAILLTLALRLPPGWVAWTGALRFTSFNGQLLSEGSRASLVGDPSPLTVVLFSLVLMAAVLPWSAVFPVFLRLVTRRIADAGTQFALLFSLYTMGNVVGAFLTGLVLFDLVGTGGTAVVAVVVSAAAVVLVTHGRQLVSSHSGRIAVAALAVSAVLMPLDYYRAFAFDRYKVDDVYEGTMGVATVVPADRFYTIIDINRTASASAMVHDPAPTDEYEAWRWNHTELMALDPGFRPKEVLVIGIGHAYLIDALLDLDFIENITIVDISAEIVRAVREHTRTSTARIFSDPRVNIVIADGRRFVQKALERGDAYDLIQTKINEPWHAGSGNLFTVEFFAAQKALLRPNGYLGLRPVVGHVNDALSVFGNGFWPGYYHMFFRNGEPLAPTEAVVTDDIREAWYRAVPGKTESTERKNVLDVTFLHRNDFLTGFTNTDDRPSFEYYWLRRTAGVPETERAALWDLQTQPRKIPIRLE